MVRVASGLDIGAKVIAVFGPRKGSLDSPETRLRLAGHLIETGFDTPKEQLPTALQTRIVRSKHGITSYAPPEEVLNIFRLKRLCRISRLDLLRMLFCSVLAPKQAIGEGVF